MASLNESRDHNNSTAEEIVQSLPSIPSLEEEQTSQATTTANGYMPVIDHATVHVPLVMSIDTQPTQVNLDTVHKSSFHTSLLDGLSIDQQTTWIIPVVRDPGEAAKLKLWGLRADGYISQIRDLIRDTGIYALSSVASPLISLVLAPFLTHHLSRPDYGALAVLNTFIALVAGITQLGLRSAFFRAYTYDYESRQDRLDVTSTYFILLLSISLPTAIMAVVAAPSIASFLNVPSLGNAVRICGLVILVQNLALPGLSWLRGENRVVFFTVVSIINLLVSAGATIFFVGIIHLGLGGALLATGAGYAVIVLCTTLPIILLRTGLRLRFNMARQMLAFGFPHALNLISGWVLQLLDRYLLVLLGSLSQTAGYAVAYSLGGALSSVLISPFSLAWWVIIYSIAKREDALRVFRLIFRWFSIVSLFTAYGLSIVGVILLDFFFPISYHSSAPVIPVIALSTVFNGVFVVLSVGTSLKRKTWLSTVSIASSALLNTALNFVLIPYFGAMGAALATLIAYMALALISHIINQRIYPVPFEIGRFLIATLIGIALYIGSSFLAQTQGRYVAWGISFGGLVLYGLCLAFLGTFPTGSSKNKYTSQQA